MEIKQINKDGRILFEVDGKVMPLYDENGNTNTELMAILNSQKNEDEKLQVYAKPSKFANMKASVKRNKHRIIAGGLALVVVAGICMIVKSCNGKNNKSGDSVSIVEVQDEKYSRELLIQRIKSFTETANSKGIQVSEEEVRDFAAFMNIDRIVNEDPELAKELFDGKNVNDVMSNAGHMIGLLMTSSVKENYANSMNLSDLVVGADYDKDIMKKLENYRDELTAIRAEEPGMHRVTIDEDKQTRYDEIVNDTINFYAMTSDGLEIDGDNAVIQKMGDGDRFSLILVMNEIAMSNKNSLNKEQSSAFKQMVETDNTNVATVANLQNLIAGCQTEELEQDKQLTK